MKKLFFTLSFLVFLFQLCAQVSFTALSFSPQFPQANSTVNFEYNSNYSPLIRQKNIETVVYIFTPNGYKILEPVSKNANGIYKGTFKLDSNASAIAIAFSAGEDKDINAGKGYIIPVYDNKKMPVKDYYAAAANLQSGLGANLFGMKTDETKGLSFLDESITLYPDIKNNSSFLKTYFFVLFLAKKNDAQALILNELALVEKRKNLNEADYNLLIEFYNKYKQKPKSDSLSIAMKMAHPDGTWKKNEVSLNFNKEKDLKKKQTLFN